jgi:hypothetical protein
VSNFRAGPGTVAKTSTAVVSSRIGSKNSPRQFSNLRILAAVSSRIKKRCFFNKLKPNTYGILIARLPALFPLFFPLKLNKITIHKPLSILLCSQTCNIAKPNNLPIPPFSRHTTMYVFSPNLHSTPSTGAAPGDEAIFGPANSVEKIHA